MEDYDKRYNQVAQVYYTDDSMERGGKGGGWFSTETRTKREAAVIDWFGLMSRYFVVLMIPANDTITETVWDSRGNTSCRIAGLERVKSIAPGQKLESSFKIAVGEKQEDILVSVDPKIEAATDVNRWIQPIRMVVMWCITWINGLVGNLGIAIIIFSIITKLIFLPLTQKSTKSMQKMSELGPKMNELKEKYKDKPEEIQRRTMQLYKEHGVNPLSGCLPMLVQMPFFIALYSALSNTLESHNAPFALWITDLSLPDTVFSMYGFNLNILPIIMTVTMYFSTRMSQTGAAVNDQQQMMMKLMPLIFIVMFWNMPSGLIIYWIVQNTLQIAHQYYVKLRAKA
jgi:YidC/Oxa1 family membrane protein insertase